ncbi:MAG: MipA/OmpV family protein [Betaproteobacteria bacterium HGW-Betaproteobacteria-13]|jgi:outer membrane scaffolding protein for murein synthesis (MipA/OmpV family)|nr:MAG: MipA/OmpV family protein [Betaproteobacteria bacterium HGW-Betaproteobacteria-19]PKO81639.1 MAG: MipA/OmpV family protein [Betaproteobacteria bacterium HGW-Betaproteobacteria-13]
MKPNALSSFALGALLAAGAALPAHAGEEKPLWELGLGVGAVSFPDYRGSDRQRVHGLAVPYFVYRGEFFKADRDGIRSIFFDSDRVQLNLSMSASLPVDSDGNSARRGMPDLKPTVEIGPSLEFNLWRTDWHNARIDLRLPVRAAYTVKGPVKHVGVTFTPFINLDIDPFGDSGWNLGMMAGPIYANARQHRYFYDVKPEFALPDRPAYEASGGYSGAQFITALSKRFDRFWVGSFLRYDTLRGAAFADSPLVQRDHAWAAGVAIAWVIGESSRKVVVED